MTPPPPPPGGALGGAPCWAALGPDSGTHCTRPFPQLLQGDPADGASQRPGHEHTLGRDFPGKGGPPLGSRRHCRVRGVVPPGDGQGVKPVGPMSVERSAPSQPYLPRSGVDGALHRFAAALCI